MISLTPHHHSNGHYWLYDLAVTLNQTQQVPAVPPFRLASTWPPRSKSHRVEDSYTDAASAYLKSQELARSTTANFTQEAMMAGSKARNKGKVGERMAKALLIDHDFTVLADTTSGLESGDIIAKSPCGIVYDVEVKNRRQINIPLFLGQARKNASKTKLSWMVLCKIETTSSWLVLRKGEKPTTWHEKVRG